MIHVSTLIETRLRVGIPAISRGLGNLGDSEIPIRQTPSRDGSGVRPIVRIESGPVRRVNTMLGLFVPAIVTPLELLGGSDDAGSE